MLRLLALLLALALPVAASAQDAGDGEPVVLTGVVRDQGAAYEPIGSVDYYGQSVSFAVWREGDGLVETTLLWLSIKVDTRAQQQALQDPFRKGRLVRLVIEGPVTYRTPPSSPPFAEAGFVRMLEPAEDPELSAAAALIFRPDAITDPELGTFEPHPRLLDQFEQERDWSGSPAIFGLIFEPMGPTARDRALAMARLAWTDRMAIDETIREAITDHIYSRRAEQAGIMLVPVGGGEPILRDELPPLPRAEFKTDHTLTRVACSAQDYCVFAYDTNRLDWSYSYEATIRRDGDGWQLDGWDFP
jgi:hypothetical protein